MNKIMIEGNSPTDLLVRSPSGGLFLFCFQLFRFGIGLGYLLPNRIKLAEVN
jgi:hypothetical protein